MTLFFVMACMHNIHVTMCIIYKTFAICSRSLFLCVCGCMCSYGISRKGSHLLTPTRLNTHKYIYIYIYIRYRGERGSVSEWVSVCVCEWVSECVCVSVCVCEWVSECVYECVCVCVWLYIFCVDPWESKKEKATLCRDLISLFCSLCHLAPHRPVVDCLPYTHFHSISRHGVNSLWWASD